MDHQSLHEINRYADAAFPVGMYTVTKSEIIPEGRGYMDLHWHEELQFTLVVKGTVDMRVDGRQYTLKENQAIFINRNLLHVTNGLSEEGRYISINFPDRLLGFFAGKPESVSFKLQDFTGNGNLKPHRTVHYRDCPAVRIQ